MAIKVVRIGRTEQCLSDSPSSTSSLESHSDTSTSASPTRSPPLMATSTSAFVDITTALSTISMEDDYSWCRSDYELAEDRGHSRAFSPPPLSWSPPPSDSYPLRLPSPAYVPRSPTPHPPLNSAELSPLVSPSPMNLEYPSPMPQPSLEEPSSPVIPPAPLTFTPDGLEPPWQLWTTQLSYPPYTIDLGEGPIILPYV